MLLPNLRQDNLDFLMLTELTNDVNSVNQFVYFVINVLVYRLTEFTCQSIFLRLIG